MSFQKQMEKSRWVIDLEDQSSESQLRTIIKHPPSLNTADAAMFKPEEKTRLWIEKLAYYDHEERKFRTYSIHDKEAEREANSENLTHFISMLRREAN